MKYGKLQRFFDFSDCIIDIGMLLLVLKFWLAPKAGDVADIATFSVLIGFEFIMVHSGPMMLFAAAFSPWIALGVFFPAYGLFALAFNMMVDNNAVMWVYLGVVFWRMRYAFSRPPGLEYARVFKSAFFKAFIYVGALMLGAGLLQGVMPHFGLTREFLEAAGYTGGDSILSRPHVAMGIAAVYYAGLAVFDFWLGKDPRRLATPF